MAFLKQEAPVHDAPALLYYSAGLSSPRRGLLTIGGFARTFRAFTVRGPYTRAGDAWKPNQRWLGGLLSQSTQRPIGCGSIDRPIRKPSAPRGNASRLTTAR